MASINFIGLPYRVVYAFTFAQEYKFSGVFVFWFCLSFLHAKDVDAMDKYFLSIALQ